MKCPENDHICDRIPLVRDIARHLMAQGFVVKELRITLGKPHIRIEHTPLCATFKGAVRRSVTKNGVRKAQWAAHYRHCEIEWETIYA